MLDLQNLQRVDFEEYVARNGSPQPVGEDVADALAWLLKQEDGGEMVLLTLSALISGARKLVKYHKEHS